MAKFKSGLPRSRMSKQHIYTKQSNRATNSYGKKFMQFMRKQAANAKNPGNITGVGISKSGSR